MIDTLTDLTADSFATIGTLTRDGWFYSFPADELRWFRGEREAGRIISGLRRQDDGVMVMVAKIAKAPPPTEQASYRFLTVNERDTIRRLRAEGQGCTQIGQVIGRSPETVRYAVRKMEAACV